MGMFDTYKPSASLRCPVCLHPLEVWQGKDGPCGLFVWEEGAAAPVDQDVDEGIALALAERDAIRLPEAFTIYSYDCPAHDPINARCHCVSGVWATTVIDPW
jgi:hypothetical protein